MLDALTALICRTSTLFLSMARRTMKVNARMKQGFDQMRSLVGVSIYVR